MLFFLQIIDNFMLESGYQSNNFLNINNYKDIVELELPLIDFDINNEDKKLIY